MKLVLLVVACLLAIFLRSSTAAPGFLQGSESAGTQHGLSLGGVTLLNIGGGYTKGAAIGSSPQGDGPAGGAAAGGSAGFSIGIGPLQYSNHNSAGAQTSYST